MGKNNRRPSAASDYYANHLYGNHNFNRNAITARHAMIQRMYIRVLTELACNRFKWDGLPKSVDIRFMEMTLFEQALSIFYFDKDYDKFFALNGTMTNGLNMMNNPTGFMTVGLGPYTPKQLPAYVPDTPLDKIEKIEGTDIPKVAIPIWANYMRVPDIDIIHIYSSKLADIDVTIEINAHNARRNKVIIGPDGMRLSTVNVSRQMDEGVQGIQINSNGPLSDLGFVTTVDLGINADSIEKLDILRVRQWNACMGLLGIDNANQDKKERLVASEVDANNDQSNMMRYVALNARRTAAEQINTVFGKNVRVEYYTDIDKMVTDAEDSLGMNTD